MGCYLVFTIAHEPGDDRGVRAIPEVDALMRFPRPYYSLADAKRVARAIADAHDARPEAEREAERVGAAVVACNGPGECEPHYTVGDARALDAWHAAEDKRGGDAYSPGGAWLE